MTDLDIQKNVPLSPYTTYQIGGPARWFCKVKDRQQLLAACSWAEKKDVDYFILGAGSNVLVSDQGFKGLVIKNELKEIERRQEKVFLDSGVQWSKAVAWTKDKRLSGLEFTVGIPGTVGGGIVSNAGIGEKEIVDILLRMKVYSPEQKKLYWLDKDQCQLAYRSSRFQESKEVIVKAVFQLQKATREEINQQIKKYLQTRKKQPKGKSIGCIFENPPGDYAGRLLDQADLKGKRVGDIVVSEKHANFFINQGDGRAADVLKLINKAKKRVQEKFSVQLEEEITKLGSFDV